MGFQLLLIKFSAFLPVAGDKNKKSCISFDTAFFIVWCHQESNRGHKDFQSFALPTELWHQRFSECGCKDTAFFGKT